MIKISKYINLESGQYVIRGCKCTKLLRVHVFRNQWKIYTSLHYNQIGSFFISHQYIIHGEKKYFASNERKQCYVIYCFTK